MGKVVVGMLCVLAMGASSAAQTTSSIIGVVEDQSGGAVAGAKVTVTSPQTGAVRTVLTGDGGRYVVAVLAVGMYEVRVEANGFRPMVQQEIQVVIGEPAVVNFTLSVGPLEQEVRVAGLPPLVNTQTAELSYLVSGKMLEDIPLNGRNYADLALLQPGVVAYLNRDGGSVVAYGKGMSINGQDPRANTFLLDGTNQNNFTNGPAGSSASTTLGIDMIHEFRVESNAYSAEFGRTFGGQVNVITKSGTNEYHGTVSYFHRNDALDARNFFDTATKPEFARHQFGGTLGGPIRQDKNFFFVGYEGLREDLGRTVPTFVPDDNARLGLLPNPASPCGAPQNVGVAAAVAPYLSEYPVANGALVTDAAGCPTGIARFTFPFSQTIHQNFGQARYDHNFTPATQFFARYTHDDADFALPTDYPQFPRSFISRNRYFTAEIRHAQANGMLHTFRSSYSRTRIGQQVQADVPASMAPFVPGRLVGDIDVGGMLRFGPQTSVNVSLVQNSFGGEYALVIPRGRHLLKFGGLVEHYQDNLFNPTFSLGIYTFANLRTFLLNQPLRYIGLTPEGQLDRYWRFTMFGMYAQDEIRVRPGLTVTLGLRYEFSTMPKDIKGRDSALINLTDPTPTLGQLYQNPTFKNISPRVGIAWDVFGSGKTSLRAGYGTYFNTNHQQDLIVTITNPPATPRVVINQPAVTFPNPPFASGLGNTIRPVDWNIKNPNVHVWNLNVQQELWKNAVVMVGYAGARGIHLARSGDVNTPTATILPDGTPFYPVGATRPNPAFTTIEQKRSDGDSWYNALVFEVRKRWSQGLAVQSSYTFSRTIDTTQSSTFFSDSTNGTTSAFPEFPGLSYNKGLADFHSKHNWVFNFIWELPFGGGTQGMTRTLVRGWQVSGIGSLRSGNPLTIFVQRNVSRSLWSPSLGPGLGFDRPNFAPGRTAESAVTGNPNAWFDPTAFAVQPFGTMGNTGRGAFIGPNLRTFDLSLAKNTPFAGWGREMNIQLRLDAFNLFNRANFGVPGLLAFAGCPALPINSTTPCVEPTLPSFGVIRNTVTSSRQVQIGFRWVF